MVVRAEDEDVAAAGVVEVMEVVDVLVALASLIAANG